MRGSKFSLPAAGPRTDRRWCIFTSAGNHNAISLWLKNNTPRRWDLVVAYYGDNSEEFSEIKKVSTYAFRAKGGKYQNLKKFLSHKPGFFDQYSYVWACDDDIKMSATQIDEAFAITEFFDFWIAQPAFSPYGKNSHWITIYAGLHCDYRIVNFVECGVAIFRRDKLIEFLKVYDGSLTGYGIDYWYLNLFKAHKLGHLKYFLKASELGRFAIIDRVQVINPHDEEKGGREILRLEPPAQMIAGWHAAMTKHGLVEFRHRVFATCKISSHSSARIPVKTFDVARGIASSPIQEFRRGYAKIKIRGYQLTRGRHRAPSTD